MTDTHSLFTRSVLLLCQRLLLLVHQKPMSISQSTPRTPVRKETPWIVLPLNGQSGCPISIQTLPGTVQNTTPRLSTRASSSPHTWASALCVQICTARGDGYRSCRQTRMRQKKRLPYRRLKCLKALSSQNLSPLRGLKAPALLMTSLLLRSLPLLKSFNLPHQHLLLWSLLPLNPDKPLNGHMVLYCLH